MFNAVVPKIPDRDLRDKLLTTAIEMLAEPQAVAVPSLRSIARACDVVPSAVYWHFPSESDLRSAVLEREYAGLVACVEESLASAQETDDLLVVAGDAYIAWGLGHPGAYQLLFESGDPLPETLVENGPRLQRRIVDLASRVDPAMAFPAALMLWSCWHGIVSLRLHKTDWNWGLEPHEVNARIVEALTVVRSLSS